jgi:hypothetical protein
MFRLEGLIDLIQFDAFISISYIIQASKRTES